MKTILRLAFFSAFLFSGLVYSQTNVAKRANTATEEEEGPIMFQFEPNYETATLLQREALVQKIKALDTLQISEKKRLRMIKQLYKQSRSISFEKSVLVNTEFDDVDYEH